MKSQKIRILELLKQRPVKNYEFFRMNPPILRASERIRELKKDGHDIVTKKLKARGVWEYKLNTGIDWEKENMFDGIARADLKEKWEQLSIRK